MVRQQGTLRHGELVIEWRAGMSSALDAERISAGRDIGYVEVFRIIDGERRPAAHDVTFAFAFKAFAPDGAIHGQD